MDNGSPLQDKAAADAAVIKHHRRFGLKLFAAYLTVYAGFIGIATAKHAWLSTQTFFGVNLAVLFGFGLIGFAFILALVFLVAGDKQEEK